MNILVQNPYMQAGGAENRIRNLLEVLINRNDIDVIHFMFIGQETAHNIQSDGKFHLWQVRKDNVLGATKNIIKEFDIDIVQLHNNQMIGTDGIEYAQSIGIPTIWVMHDFWTLCAMRFMIPVWDAMKHPVCDKIDQDKCTQCVGDYEWRITKQQREVVNNCDVAIVPSERIKKIFERNNFMVGKLKVIVPWITLDKFHPTGASHDGMQVFFAGNFIQHKGIMVLLKAWAIVQKRLPQARLVIQGDSRMGFQTSNFINSLGLQNVRMMNHMPQEQLRNLFNTSAVTVFPSIWEETFGQVWAESLACGTPVIASKIGGIADTMKEGGVFFEPRNHVELAENIIDLLLSPSKRQVLANAGVNYVRTAFTRERAAAEFVELYYKLEARI